MSCPLVHIGYHKTASTWFQRSFYRRVTNRRYVKKGLVRRALLWPGAFEFAPERAREQLELKSPDEPVVLCEEGLSGYLHNGGMRGFFSAEIARRLHATLPAARIVIFVRSQPEMIASCYQQYVRSGGTHRPERYLHPDRFLEGASRHPYKIPRFDFEHFRYLPLIRHYQGLFGAEAVHVYAFEDFRRDSPGFLQRYAQELGLELSEEVLPDGRTNASFSMPLLRLARVLNRFTARSVEDKHYLLHLPGWYEWRGKHLESFNRKRRRGSPKSVEVLGEEEVRAIEECYRESNRELAAHTGLELAELGYPV